MPPKIEEIVDDDDDGPPELEDMTESLRIRQKFATKGLAQVEKKEKQLQAEKVEVAEKTSTVQKPTFAVGTIVKLHGLSAEKYNDLEGNVASFDPQSGRYTIDFKKKGQKSIKVKPTNLKRLESFSGFGKGFFANAKAKSDDNNNNSTNNNTNINNNSKVAKDDDDGIEFIKPKAPNETPGQFAEVQDAMKNAAPFLEQTKEQWCTPDLMTKLAKNPEMLQMMQNPQFMSALSEFQANPKEAMTKYGNNPQVSGFFKQFCAVMGDHLTELGDQQEQKQEPQHPHQQQQPHNTVPQMSPEDEKKINAELAKPEVVNALLDRKIQMLIKTLKETPEKMNEVSAQVMRDPDLRLKVGVLQKAGILGTQ